MTTPIKFSNLREGGITAMKLNKAFALATGDGTGGGDMTKAVYDSNNDGISDHAALADATPWAGITGKPASFPPDSTAMLKSVYDTNGDGISDHAALADTATTVAWTGVTGKPATFPPDSTAELIARKGAVNGYAGLDGAGKVPTAQLPATMTAAAHAATHLSAGSDPIAVATTVL